MIDIDIQAKQRVYSAFNDLTETRKFNIEFWDELLPTNFIRYHSNKIGNVVEDDDFITEINRFAFDYLFSKISPNSVKNYIRSNFGGWEYSNESGDVFNYIWTHRDDLKKCNFNYIIENPNASIKLFIEVVDARIEVMDVLIEAINGSIRREYNPNFDETKAMNIIHDLQESVDTQELLGPILAEAKSLLPEN